MAEYKLEVTTGDMANAGTFDYVYVTLFGTERKSERTELASYCFDFETGTTRNFTIKTPSLGKLLLVKLEKEPAEPGIPVDEWYCSKIVVTTPEGEVILFPCYRWISRGEWVELRGGRAMKGFEEDHPLLIDHRKKELQLKRDFYKWRVTEEGTPHSCDFDNISELPAEIRYSEDKSTEVEQSKMEIGIQLTQMGLLGSTKQWESLESMKRLYTWKKTTMSDYVTEHWMEDDFYGSQFLNGVNPNVIKRCSKLPTNFPVTEEMVKPFLEEGSSLQKEMEKGNIFLHDQKIMEGIPTRKYNGETLYVAAGLCLFYKNPKDKLMPIAIQLHQQPSEQHPIFLPSDSETDWMLAKMFIKNADIIDHQGVEHLMKTHFLTEAFAVAALRSFSVIHPLYKLLFPHFRYTMSINTEGRVTLFGSEGPLSISSLGYDGVTELMRRALSKTTYSSFCLPENITARGLESIPNFYYRDDGLQLWNIVNSFVKAVVEYYYRSDSDVCRDTELQNWISEIFTHGLLGNKASGFPESFGTVAELVKFVTMVIFTVTGQHAAVNNGQFDYHSWVPNGTLLLLKPPPTTKGQSSMETVFETFPTVGETASFASLIWVLTKNYEDKVYMGIYPEVRFDEPAPLRMIEEFNAKLSLLSEAITNRNLQLDVPYIYMNPTQIENSVTI